MGKTILCKIKFVLKFFIGLLWELYKMGLVIAIIAASVYLIGFFWSLGKEAAAALVEYYIWRGGLF